MAKPEETIYVERKDSGGQIEVTMSQTFHLVNVEGMIIPETHAVWLAERILRYFDPSKLKAPA